MKKESLRVKLITIVVIILSIVSFFVIYLFNKPWIDSQINNIFADSSSKNQLYSNENETLDDSDDSVCSEYVDSLNIDSNDLKSDVFEEYNKAYNNFLIEESDFKDMYNNRHNNIISLLRENITSDMSCNSNGVKYKILDCYITDNINDSSGSLNEIVKNNMLDENRKLRDEYSFVVIDMEIVNESKNNISPYYLNIMSLWFFNKEDVYYREQIEYCTFQPGTNKGLYRYDLFRTNECIHCSYVVIVPTEGFERYDCYLCINPSWSNQFILGTDKFILLEEIRDERS